MVEEAARHSRPMGSHDQGIHNYLLRTGRLDPVYVQENGCGAVLTMGLQKQIDVDSEGRILNHRGDLPAVLHQYDRHVELAARLRESIAC